MCASAINVKKRIFSSYLYVTNFSAQEKPIMRFLLKPERFRWIWVNGCRSLIIETGPYRTEAAETADSLFAWLHWTVCGVCDGLIQLRNLQEHRGPRCSQKRVTHALGIKRSFLASHKQNDIIHRCEVYTAFFTNKKKTIQTATCCTGWFFPQFHGTTG